MPRTKAHMRRRCTCGFCDVTQRVRSPVDSSKRATQARGSIALATSRWLTMRFLTTTSALLNAASMSPPPSSHLNATLLGAPACISAAPDWPAAPVAVTEGFTSLSTVTSLDAALDDDHRDGVAHVTGDVGG